MDNYIIYLLGIVATILSQVYRLPQIYKIYQTKTGNDISIFSIFIQTISYIFYILYSVFNWDLIYIISNIISLVENIIVYLLIKYYSPAINNE
jgi:uncharacterized protein with PQ loop repeat